MSNYTGLKLEPVSALGISILDRGSIFWNAPRQFFYPIGQHIFLYEADTNQSRFLFPERFGPSCAEVIKLIDIACSSNGQFVAISEIYRPNHGILSIYDTESQVAHVHLRHDAVDRFTSLSFSSDGTFITALGIGQNDNRVFVWKIVRQVALVAILTVATTTRSIYFDPQDPYRLVLFGDKCVHSVKVNTIDKVLKEIDAEHDFDHAAFVPAVNGLLVAANDIEMAVIMNDSVIQIMQPVKEGTIRDLKAVKNLLFIVSESIVYLYKANTSAPYLSYIGPIDLSVQLINEFSPSPDADSAVVLHDNSYAGLLDINVAMKILKQNNEAKENAKFPLDKEQENELNSFLSIQADIDIDVHDNVVNIKEMQQFIGLFNPLQIRYHIGPIVAVATCPRKPLLATCGGQDRTLLVWNLAKKTVIASEKLSEPVNSCDFHPSGDLLAVGTSEKLLLYSLTFDSLVLRQKWEPFSCTCVSFSNGGHLLAAGSLIIKVISTYSAKTVTSLRGHNLSVKSISWAPNDAFFISSGLDGNVFKWSAKSWERINEISLPTQLVNGILTNSNVNDDTLSDSVNIGYNILVATSNNTIYDMGNKTERMPNRKRTLTAIEMPVPFSLISGDARGNLQIIPYPLLPAGDENPFHIGVEVSVHTSSVNCIVSSSDAQTLFTASDDSSLFIFNIVQPHQMVITSPVLMAFTRGEQSFLIEKISFEEKKDNLIRLREMMNLHRSQYQLSSTRLNEIHSREIMQEKNRWQMTLLSLQKQAHALANQKAEQEKKATELISESDSQHYVKIKKVKELYENKLSEQTRRSAALMKEKIRVQCEFEEKIHRMTEEYKKKLLAHREEAQKQLEIQAIDNTDAEKQFKQVKRLQIEEVSILHLEHEREMEEYKQQFEQQISDLLNQIDCARTALVGDQDTYESQLERQNQLKNEKEKIAQEKQILLRKQKTCSEQINVLKNELLARSERVERQTNHLLAFKAKNEELNKWRNVMDYRLNKLKIQTDPKTKEIEGLRKQIDTNEDLLRSMKKTSQEDDHKLKSMESEINDLYNEIIKSENATSKCDAKIKQFKNRLHSIYTEVDPEKWGSELKKMYKEYVRESNIDKEDKTMVETLSEFDRHKDALSAKVTDLRNKIENDTATSGNSYLKQIRNNENMIKDLQKLREENKKLRSELHFVQTNITTLMRQCSRESKTLETKVKTMFKSSNILHQPSQPNLSRKVTKSGLSVVVEHFI